MHNIATNRQIDCNNKVDTYTENFHVSRTHFLCIDNSVEISRYYWCGRYWWDWGSCSVWCPEPTELFPKTRLVLRWTAAGVCAGDPVPRYSLPLSVTIPRSRDIRPGHNCSSASKICWETRVELDFFTILNKTDLQNRVTPSPSPLELDLEFRLGLWQYWHNSIRSLPAKKLLVTL